MGRTGEFENVTNRPPQKSVPLLLYSADSDRTATHIASRWCVGANGAGAPPSDVQKWTNNGRFRPMVQLVYLPGSLLSRAPTVEPCTSSTVVKRLLKLVEEYAEEKDRTFLTFLTSDLFFCSKNWFRGKKKSETSDFSAPQSWGCERKSY